MQLARKNWIWATACLLVISSVLAVLPIPSSVRTAAGDILPFLLILLAIWLLARNAFQATGRIRLFWIALAAGCTLWASNLGIWIYYEVALQRSVPDPYPGDAILFLHVVPFIAAVVLQAHQAQNQQKGYFSTLNFCILLVWWVFLYSFVVFPDQYVVLRKAVYSHSFDLLYLTENAALALALGIVASQTRHGWRSIYWNLFVSASLYTWSSTQISRAIALHQYATGGLYDVAFIASICWFIYAALLGQGARSSQEASVSGRLSWDALTPRLSMVAILSLPLFGGWEIFFDTASEKARTFRLFATLTGMLVLGAFVFVRQMLMDRELVRVLNESREHLRNLQKLQSELVQKEKLASLGQVVAGAAHEINNPLTAILGYSDLLVEDQALPPEQVTIAKKIGQQARRTSDLVAGLLNFAQQVPAEKSLIDIGAVVKRAVQAEGERCSEKNIRVETQLASHLPKVFGSANQLLKCCSVIILNAIDALEEVGGGTLSIKARREGDEVVVEFSDSGAGIKDPQRVFDPFYTTKPIGKGKGLGLSAAYGMVQEHQGQITCRNRPEGGAIFELRLPAAANSELLRQVAKA